ncbi:uncharacterized protein LOC111887041 [Lactuca sativa]|uniref:uncharacterized protein LOC111887041 n=1 Tax=Lactuca sativa TaxID=4236 RepID=UPI000CD9BA7A|nr:uncharacterized protein LOC111887041 [Lactuca sativa]
MIDIHKCVRNFNNSRLMDPTWLARKFMKELIRKPIKMQRDAGRDANNQVYPIAWAVVNVENKNNWKWFLDLVNDDLGLQGAKGVCVISDQHKGLVEASKDIRPYVEHRQCARHIYANFRKVYSGVQFRNMFWAAAKSNIEGDFKFNMERIREISSAAYDHTMAREPTSWCKAYFSIGLACEAVENGIDECFNAIIVDARKKPLLTMLEDIRLYMMERAFNLKQEAENWVGEVCPSMITKMEEFGEDIKSWHAVPSGVNEYEVRNGFQNYGVNLKEKFVLVDYGKFQEYLVCMHKWQYCTPIKIQLTL